MPSFCINLNISSIKTVNEQQIGRKQHCRVDQKPVNGNPGLKINPANNFFVSVKMLSNPSVSYSLRLVVLKTEGQKI